MTGVPIELAGPATTIRFGVTKHRVTLIARAARGSAEAARPGPGLVDVAWARLDDLGDLTFGSATRRLIAWARAHRADLELDRSP